MPLLGIWKKKGELFRLVKNVISQIKFEIDQINQLFNSYTDILEHSQKATPNLVELTAIASVLHSFYNGAENIFLSITKGFNEEVPKGSQWHRDLLVRMTQQTPKRNYIISVDLAQKLAEYLSFRHFYRHSYSFFLEWDEIEKLVTHLQEIWVQLKKELTMFMNSLSSG